MIILYIKLSKKYAAKCYPKTNLLYYGAAVFNLWYYPMGIYVSIVPKTTSYSTKKPIRYMHKAHYNAHTKPLFYASNVLNINNTYRLEVTKFMYDFTRRKLPIPILDFFASNLAVHQHNTRHAHDPHFTIIHNSTADKSILHRGPRIWSDIPQPMCK